ncbi:hypothetical protein [Prosthecochloris sp. SCSIO W1103]|uniref:hypothetical protein n=1 Tax=Prosthecochloris sp. SCSIO W1103 TaxID=2992244 RepID=UPI00223E6AF3|nr:hypothetical protein [Prosthecochloris sp. SCSIO W1103]UZJ38396.1 hypothetical protein OO005_04120 [Prosthecochloris sp. SCSIO W1103]
MSGLIKLKRAQTSYLRLESTHITETKGKTRSEAGSAGAPRRFEKDLEKPA